MTYIRSFHEVGADSVGLVGGKGANLGEMTRAGLPVPPGFCLTAAAYSEFLQVPSGSGGTARDTIRAILAQTRLDDPADVDAQAERIRAFLEAQPVPAPIAAEVLERYHALGSEMGPATPPPPVAVRSSATAEDLPTAPSPASRIPTSTSAATRTCWTTCAAAGPLCGPAAPLATASSRASSTTWWRWPWWSRP